MLSSIYGSDIELPIGGDDMERIQVSKGQMRDMEHEQSIKMEKHKW